MFIYCHLILLSLYFFITRAENDQKDDKDDVISRLLRVESSVFSGKPWSPIDSSGPREILNIVERKVKDGSIGRKNKPDKFHLTHAYQQMYGMYLLPYVERHHEQSIPIKFFEIGLGCVGGDRLHGYSQIFTGLTIWKEILDSSKDELWSADIDRDCVEKTKSETDYLKGVNVVTGDQGDEATLKRWVEETGGHFDIVIDDGAHLNSKIYTSFTHLWPHVKPGGLYFIEDLHVVRNKAGSSFGDDSDGKYIMADVIRDWLDQLIVPVRKSQLPSHISHRIPKGVKWITCQMEACVIAKAEEHDVARSS